jgi:hypothetical protein
MSTQGVCPREAHGVTNANAKQATMVRRMGAVGMCIKNISGAAALGSLGL